MAGVSFCSRKLLVLLGLAFVIASIQGCRGAATGFMQAWNKEREQRRVERTIPDDPSVDRTIRGDPKYVEVAKRFGACTKSVEDKPMYALLDLKSPDLDKMTSDHLFDQSKATDSEKTLIRLQVSELENCYRPGMYADADGAVGAIFLALDRTWTASMFEAAKLYNGVSSWGEYNTRGMEIVNQLRREIREIKTNMDQQMDRVRMARALNAARSEREALQQQLFSVQAQANRAEIEAQEYRSCVHLALSGYRARFTRC